MSLSESQTSTSETPAQDQTATAAAATTDAPFTVPVLEDTELPNVVPESPQEQTVDFSIDLVDLGYRELLDDPDSPQYVDLAHHLQEQVSASTEPAVSAVVRTSCFLSPLPSTSPVCPDSKEA